MIFFFLIIATAYVWGVMPSLHWLDTADLTLASVTLGIGHPPGQPVDAMLGYVAQMLPIGDLSFRKTLVSLLSLLGTVVLISSWSSKLGKTGKMPLFVLGVFALSSIVLFQGVRPELYALVALLCLASIYTREQGEEDARFQYLSCFLWGLAATIHPLIAIGSLPFFFRKTHPVAGIFLGLSLLTLLYLPLRAVENPEWNFGSPQNMERFLWFVKGELYKAYDDPASAHVFSHLREIGGLFVRSLTPVGLGLGFLGIATLLLTKPKVGGRFLVLFAWAIGTLAAMGNFWSNNPDAWGYLNVVLWGLALCAMFFTMQVWSLLRRRWLQWAFALLVFLGVGQQALGYWDQLQSDARDWSAHRHMVELAREPAENARLFSSSFSTFGFMRYAQVVEGRRPDLQIRYRGLSQPADKDSMHGPMTRPPIWWELALRRRKDGRYTLRNLDLKLVSGLEAQGWFYRLQSPGRPQKEVPVLGLRRRTLGVQAELGHTKNFQEEALVLNYVVHILKARMDGNLAREKELSRDMQSLFPGFQDFHLLAEKE